MTKDFNSNQIKAIVGLGNPTADHALTYHNAGQIALSAFINLSSLKTYKNFQYTKLAHLIIALPTTFMNNSGLAVKDIVFTFNLKPSDLIIVHDDSDLALGKNKLEFAKNSAGHHGINSIISHLNTKDFWRLRIGVRQPNNRSKAGNFILKTIPPEDLNTIYKAGEFLKEKLKLNDTSVPA